MKTKLYKSVTTHRKVSFIEGARISGPRYPIMLRLPKETWLELGRPETLEVEVSAYE